MAWDDYANIIKSITFFYSVIFYFLSFLAYYFEYIKNYFLLKSLISLYRFFLKAIFILKNSIQNFSFSNINISFAIILLASILIRVYKMDFTIMYDEAATYMDYIDEGITSLLFYKSPNNHLFHSILVKCSVGIFGDTLFTLRLPALIFGILNITLIYLLGKSLSDNISAFFACFLYACTPIIIHYDTIARGYSIITTCSLLLFYLCWNLKSKGSFKYLILIPFVSSIGFFTHLPFLFSFMGTMLWFFYDQIFIDKKGLKEVIYYLLIISFGTFILSFLLYTPTIILGNGIDQFINNKYFIESNVFGQYPDDLLSYFYNLGFYFFLNPFTIIIACGLVFYVIKIRETILYLILFKILGAIFIIYFTKSIPPYRTLLFLYPFLILSISISISSLLHSIKNKKIIILPFLQGVFYLYLIMNKSLLSYNGFPELPKVLKFFKSLPKTVEIKATRNNYYKGLKYYLQKNAMQYPEFLDIKNLWNLDSNTYIVLNKSQKFPKHKYKCVFEDGDVIILNPIY